MRRRRFTGILAAATAMSPSLAHAQGPAIGYLDPRSPGTAPAFVSGWLQGLRDGGYVEGRNLAIEYRWTEGHADRLPAMAADLASRPLAAIVAAGNSVAVAVKKATATIPIVFIVGFDPVELGLVASLSRPGGNATGVTTFSSEMVAKRLELLRDLVPGMAVAGVLVNPANPNTTSDARLAENAARILGLQLRILAASSEKELDAAFEVAAQLRIGGLSVHSDQYFDTRRDQLAGLAVRFRIPAIYNNRTFVAAGGLISYGDNRTETYRQAGFYVARILKGEKPADLPVLQPTSFQLVVNLKAAAGVGLAVQPALLTRADEVIE